MNEGKEVQTVMGERRGKLKTGETTAEVQKSSDRNVNKRRRKSLAKTNITE